MADQLYEQFTEHYNDDGLAQFKEQYNPPAPVGVADWVAYSGDLPSFRFADSAPGTLLGVQVWSSNVRKATVDKYWGGAVVPVYDADLALLWPRRLTTAGIEESLVGPAPTYTDAPTLSAGGVVPGDGPSFTDVVTWSDGGTLVVEFTATTASADLVGDVQVFGPLYACAEGLKAKDGTNTASVATSWGVGDVVTAVVQCDGDVMRVARGEAM